MKHLIKDEELMAYIEGRMTQKEAKIFIGKIKENGEMEMLYHLQCAWAASLAEYADRMLGPDDDEEVESVPIAAKDKIF